MNGINGNGSRRPLWLAVLIACIPLIPTIVVAAVYQISANVRLEAKVQANMVALTVLQDAVYGLHTPLASKVSKLEDRIDEITRALMQISAKSDFMDQNGTRGNLSLSAEVRRAIAQLDRISERVNLIDQRLGATEYSLDRTRDDLNLNTSKSPFKSRSTR